MVVKPNNNRIVGDAIKGLKLIINRIRWQEYFRFKYNDESLKSNEINKMLEDEFSINSDSNLSREWNYDKKE